MKKDFFQFKTSNKNDTPDFDASVPATAVAGVIMFSGSLSVSQNVVQSTTWTHGILGENFFKFCHKP